MMNKELFGVPVYRDNFEDHAEYKDTFLEFCKREEIYSKNSRHPEVLQLSHPDLHKEAVFNPLVSFFKTKISEAFVDMGFIPNFEITSMWSTRQPKGGYHHRHMHFNTFLAGVYYLDGNEKSSGTRFYCPHNYHKIISPARIDNTHPKLLSTFMIPFEEGSLLMFPGWLEHTSDRNRNEDPRTIIGFNVMPIGKTNIDTFDRYNYQSVEGAELVNKIDDLFKPIT
jgi:uncharacterized protein (TIGR02466 family)